MDLLKGGIMAPPVALIFSLVNFVLKRKKQQEEEAERTVAKKKIKWLEWLKESSTIRGIIVLAGLVGWQISPEGAEVAVGAAAAVIYAVYNLLRNDSVQKAKDMLFGSKGFAGLKLLVLVFVFCICLFAWVLPTLAADIYISAEGTVTSFDVEVRDPDTGEKRFSYENITDFEALGPDDVHGGIKYRIMSADFMTAGIDHSVVVRACN